MRDTDNRDVYLTDFAFVDYMDRYGSYRLVVAIQFHLEYCVSFPYVTYSDYEKDGMDVRIKKIIKATNVGRREAIEYCALVGRYLSKEGNEFRDKAGQYVGDRDACNKTYYVSDEKYNILNLSLLDLVYISDVSKRLRNCIANAEEMEYVPIKTIADYVYAGQKAKNIILKIPNMGNKTANELDALIHGKLMKYNVRTGSAEDAIKDYGLSEIDSGVRESEYDAFDSAQIMSSPGNYDLKLSEIAEKLPEVLRKSFNEREYNILMYRAINECTLERIARLYDLTNERIRQIEAEATRRIIRLYGKVFEVVINKLDEALDKYCGDVPLSRAAEILGVTSDLLKLLIYVLFRKRGRIRVKDGNVVRANCEDMDCSPLRE